MKRAFVNPRQVERLWRQLTDQPDDRKLGIEIIAPEAHLREDGKKRAHDDVEFFACQLIERQPLAKKSIWREPASRGFIHLARIQIPSPRIPGNEQVGDNYVETVSAGCEISAAVLKHETHICALEQICVPGGEMRALLWPLRARVRSPSFPLHR